MGIVDKMKQAYNSVIGDGISTQFWDMSDAYSREASVKADYEHALSGRSMQTQKMVKLDKYYNNQHITQQEVAQTCEQAGIPFIPAIVPAPYFHTESQIIPYAPDFQFKGRDNDLDSEKAKQREYVVQAILDDNKFTSMIPSNERRLGKLGNAFWKVSYDADGVYGNKPGRIVIGNPDPSCIFPDPSATDMEDAEYFIYAYPLHKRAAARQFAKQLKAVNLTMNEIGSTGNEWDTKIFLDQPRDIYDDCVQVVEYWFKQAEYGSDTKEYEFTDEFGVARKAKRKIEWAPGDIACSIQINNKEVQYIPKYWDKTNKGYNKYPFIKYCKVPNENGFWDRSDVEMIIDLTDQCDRELATAILNDTFMANDIIVIEQGALADNTEFNNVPGAQVFVKAGTPNPIKRLGGIAEPSNRLEMINFLLDMIQKTIGNYDSSMGQEPVRVTTSSGIAQLNERADAQKNIKKADRTIGFELLYELIDWTALEFYDDERLIFIGADEGEQPTIFKYNSDRLRVLNDNDNNPEYYYPRVDIIVEAGDGLQKSKAFTLQFTNDLIKTPITPQNYKIVESAIDIADIPNKKEIKEFLDKMFGQQLQQQAMGNDVKAAQGQVIDQGNLQEINQDELIQDALAQLSEEERAAVEANPELMAEILNGGVGNG